MRLQTEVLAYPFLSTAIPGGSLVSLDSPSPRLTLNPGTRSRPNPEMSDFTVY
jgi:hypothetical protein